MKYIIANPNELDGINLKKLIDAYEMLDFMGRFNTLKEAEEIIREEPPDIAFIRVGKAELDAYKLINELRELNPLVKIIFLSSHAEHAVEAFEYEAFGFLMLPIVKEKIDHILLRCNKKQCLNFYQLKTKSNYN